MHEAQSRAAARLADFEARAAYAPEDVLRHTERGWRYIPVHPFADDEQLLTRIGWEATRCLRVDAYWECEGDVYFIQVEAEGQSVRTRGLYYRWADPHGYNLVVVVDGRPIQRAMFEAALLSAAIRLPLRGRPEQLLPL